MNIFKKLFSTDIKKEHFLGGCEVSLDGSERCESFLQTQAVIDRQTAINLDPYIHLIYNDKGLLVDGAIYYEGEKLGKDDHLTKNLQLDKAIGKLKYQDLPIHKLYDFEIDEIGIHQIGGEIPAEFIMPKNNFVVPLQYLGFINNKDKAFDWLPFKLHLICPIFLNFEFLFIDYSNPLSPLIVNQSEIEKSETSFTDDLNKDTEIIFKGVRFNANEIYGYGYGLGAAGVPKWIQHPDIPRCPKTNKTMRFLCQLQGNGVTALRTNVTPKDEYYRHYYEELNFWGDGDLFVFFEPTSKVACYFIQNT